MAEIYLVNVYKTMQTKLTNQSRWFGTTIKFEEIGCMLYSVHVLNTAMNIPVHKFVHFNIHASVINLSLGTNEYTKGQIQVA